LAETGVAGQCCKLIAEYWNIAAVAMANKTARIAWAMIRNGSDYQPDFAA
jgi:hypothetical protein